MSTRVISEKRDNNSNWNLEVLIPGYGKKDIALSVKPCTTRQGSLLTIELENEKYGKDTEVIYLPHTADIDTIEATAENGILSIKVNRSEKYSARTIPVM